MKKNTTSPYRHWFSLVLILLLGMVVFIKLSRLGLPTAEASGHLDDAAVTFALLSVALGLIAAGGRWFIYLYTPLLLSVTFFSIANWWYFEFYRDFLTPDLFLLIGSTEEATWSLGALSHKAHAVLFVLLMVALLWLVSRLTRRENRRGAFFLATALISAVLSGYLSYRHSENFVRGLAHRGYHHIGFFVRELFDVTHKELLPEHAVAALTVLGRNGTDPQYPLFADAVPTAETPADAKNVIVIVLESMRAVDMGVYGAEQTVSPQLDAIAEKGLVFQQFYANSNQTIRGEMAILCSALDYVNGAPFSVSGQKLKTKCLPQILAAQGYRTLWFHGYKKEFFKRDQFMPQVGFQELHDIEAVYGGVAKEERKILGWGAPDPLTFEHAINTLEQVQGPFFAEIMTLSNHYPFDWKWDIEFPDYLRSHDEINEKYRRGMYYTDYAVGEFWRRFERSSLANNTLVVFMADHGIWSFSAEHEEMPLHAKYERYFRLPLIMRGPGIPSGVNDPSPASQIDVAPTIMSYLGIQAPNAFLGESLSPSSRGGKPIFMVAGGTFGYRNGDVICYPGVMHCSDNAYQACGLNTPVQYGQSCFKVAGDLLRDATTTSVPMNLDSVYTFFELTQISLERGHWPPQRLAHATLRPELSLH